MSALSQFAKYLIVPEIIAAGAGCITWAKWKHGYLKWFVIYLIVIVFCESANRLKFIQNNAAIPDVFKYVVPIEILAIYFFFYHTLKANNKILVWIGAIIYVISWVLENSFLANEMYYFKSLSYTTGNLFIAIFIIIFFIEFVQSEKILGFKNMAVFWIVSGMLVFYIGTFPFYGLYNEIAKNVSLFRTLGWVAISLDYLMYILFTIGFIWGRAH